MFDVGNGGGEARQRTTSGLDLSGAARQEPPAGPSISTERRNGLSAGGSRGQLRIISRFGHLFPGTCNQDVAPVAPFRLSPRLSAILNSIFDLGVLFICILAAMQVSHRSIALPLPHFVVTIFGAGAVWLAASAVIRHYDPSALQRQGAEDAVLVSLLVIVVTIFLAVVSRILGKSVPVLQITPFVLMFWPAVLCLRLLVFRLITQTESPLCDALIVGIGPLGRLTGEDLEKRGYRVVGYLQCGDENCSISPSSRLLGTSDRIEAILRSTPVSEVYIAGDLSKDAAAMQAVIAVCERLGMPFAIPAYNFRFDRALPVARQAVADGYLHFHTRELKPYQMAIKRLFDILSSAMALAMLLPAFIVIPVLIKLTSPGPVFFRQVRVGLRGKPFHLLKFRSMVLNAEDLKPLLDNQNERTGPVFKIRNDPRTTGIGRFMRTFSIDELPQLINVLRGEMSIVGPRPPVPSEVAQYEPWQYRRLAVRPGLTCIWQASPDRHEFSFERWMYLDMQYIDHWSLARDIALICKTLPVVLSGAGER